MAERVGFEPTIPFQVCPLSRRIVSTTHAPLRIKNCRRPPRARRSYILANSPSLPCAAGEKNPGRGLCTLLPELLPQPPFDGSTKDGLSPASLSERCPPS